MRFLHIQAWRFALVGLLCATPALVQAQMAPAFTYQGQLKEAGRPYDGMAYLDFSLWDALENGNQIGTTYWTPFGVDVVNGLFTVEVDALPFGPTAFNGQPRWLQIALTDAGGANPILLSPRQPMTPAPYALYALDGGGGGSFNLPYQGSTTFNGDAFEVINNGTSNAVAGSFLSPESGGVGVYGKGGADGYGGKFEGDSDAVAGVLGSTSRSYGAGVFATADASTAYALYASNSSTEGDAYAVFARTQGEYGKAVWGEARSTSGPTVGVRGWAKSPDGIGVQAWNTADTGDAIALSASTDSPDGYAGYFEGGKNYFGGNVGIGTTTPGSPLTVSGVIESEAGGFKFPDGTIQTSAGSGGGSSPWQMDVDDNIHYDAGRVGVGIASPSYPLHVFGDGSMSIYAENDRVGASGAAVKGRAHGEGGTALSGYASSRTGETYGVLGTMRSPGGAGVFGHNFAAEGGKAIYGFCTRVDSFAGYFEGAPSYFSHNVGIGTTTPGSPLTANGVIESEAGGFKFPDGTIQTTAGGGGGTTLWSQDASDNITYNDGYVGIWLIGAPTEALDVGGTIKTNGLQLGDSATAGHVLTTDADGVGTWQPSGGGGSSLWSADTWGVNYQSGNVGIGAASTSNNVLRIYGGSARTLSVQNNEPSVYASAIWGETQSTSGAAVYGMSTTDTGTAAGVHGEAATPDGYGVVGNNTDDTGTGEAVGVHGTSSSTTGIGVKGYSAAGGIGVFGEAWGSTGRGVVGESNHATGFAGYFDGRGYFSGNVGIGTDTPSLPLTVAGAIHSTVGGYVFPDGTHQTTAAIGGGSSLWAMSGSDIYYNAGKVGVGWPTPETKLHVGGGNWDVANGEGDFKIGSASYRLKMGVNTSSGRCRIFAGGLGSKLTLGASAVERLTVTTTGVVIGTIYPGAMLDVDGDVVFRDGLAELMTVESTGVGIGTSSPEATLDVEGTFRLRTAPTAGHVLTADPWGYATWQAPTGGGGITMPYDGTFTSSTVPAFKVTNEFLIGSSGSLGAASRGVEGIVSFAGSAGVYAENTARQSICELAVDHHAVHGVNNSSSTPTAFFQNNGSGPALSARGGKTIVEALEIVAGSDLSEQFDVSSPDNDPEPGMVVCIDPANPGKLMISANAYDRTVAGVISGAGGVEPGLTMGQRGSVADGDHAVALTGRVYVQADVSNGPIVPGDLLTTSDLPGHAMRVTDYGRSHGAVLGKAMTSLDQGTGLVLVLVSLQ